MFGGGFSLAAGSLAVEWRTESARLDAFMDRPLPT